MKLFKSIFAALPVAALLAFGSTAAHAGWILIQDPDSTDRATNPGTSGGRPATRTGPTDNSAEAYAAWLQDLLNLSATPTTLGAGDLLGTGTWSLTNIDPAAQYLTLHYGNYQGGISGLNDEYANVGIGFVCVNNEISCSSFSAPYAGLSNYRIFGTTTSVPEPATLALLGLGLAGMGFARRRRSPAA